MVFDDVPREWGTVPSRWLYTCVDRAPFAYAHGEEFIRYRDHARWARLSDDRLVSLRSGTCLAYRDGNVYFDALSGEPLYYVPPSVALPEPPPSGESSAVRAPQDASSHRTAPSALTGGTTSGVAGRG